MAALTHLGARKFVDASPARGERSEAHLTYATGEGATAPWLPRGFEASSRTAELFVGAV